LDRVKALKTVIGDAVPWSLVLDLLLKRAPPVVSDREFLDYFMRLLMVFDGCRLNTLLLDPETVSFLVLLYAKPPRLAFVHLDVDGSYRGQLLLSKVRYSFYRDGLSDILGPRIRSESFRLGGRVLGDYVPISGEYLVVEGELEGYEPRHVVLGKRSWYVYEVAGNPIPHNVMYLLSLLR